MKKTILFLFFFFLCIEARAQCSIIPDVSFSIIKRNDFGDGWGTGIKGGLGIENQIYSNFGVRTGLFYASRGYSLGPAFGRYEYSLENVVYEMPYTNKLKRNFLQVPLLLTYTHSLNQSLALSFGLGPYAGISVKDYWEGGYSEEHYWEGNQDACSHKSVFEGLNNFDWGISSSAAIDIHKWRIAINYDLSLGEEDKNSGINANYHSLSIGIGYRFLLGRKVN